ncbi:unnamed protein product, partial [Mesorhabditis belari]|uniref:Uncharacterized protein n=1 Tax=Mesorhabditis belari TaxID=2138241 RepID=A0AAF3FEZ3_9BILA
MSSGGREREVTSPLDQHKQQLNPKEELTYGRSKGALLPLLNVDKIDNGFYLHKIITSLFCIFFGSYPMKELNDSASTVGRMFAKRKTEVRVPLSRDVIKKVMGTKYGDPGYNVGHLIDYKCGGTNWHLDNFIVQNTIMNSAEGTKSAIDNRLEKQLKSEHSDPVCEVINICLSKVKDSAKEKIKKTIPPAFLLRLEHFDPPLLLKDGTKAEWMAAIIHNPDPKEMKSLPFHPGRKQSELYEYDFGAKNGDEAQLLTELAKLLDHDKKPEGNNSIKQLEGNEYHKELENLIMMIIKELHKPVADEKLAVAGGKLVFLKFQQSQSKNPELPDGMKEPEGKAVLKALFQAEEPPAVLHIYTSNSKCFTADPEREIKIKKIFAGKAPDYANKKFDDSILKYEKWGSIASMGQRAQRGYDSGNGTVESTKNADDEAWSPSDDEALLPPDLSFSDDDVDFDEIENQADDQPTEEDKVGLWRRMKLVYHEFSEVYMPEAPDVASSDVAWSDVAWSDVAWSDVAWSDVPWWAIP